MEEEKQNQIDKSIEDILASKMEHKIFYILHSRERIEKCILRDGFAELWINSYGLEDKVFKESDVLNFIKKNKIIL